MLLQQLYICWDNLNIQLKLKLTKLHFLIMLSWNNIITYSNVEF